MATVFFRGVENGQAKDNDRCHPPSWNFLGKQNHDGGDHKAEEHASGIAHKDFGRIAVEGKKATCPSYQCKTDYDPHRVPEVAGSPGGQVDGQEQHGGRNNGSDACAESVEPIEQIERICGAQYKKQYD
jgi:hypothetical protein